MNQSPSAGFIEATIDELKTHPNPGLVADELHELRTARGDVSEEFARGYVLGLQVARTILATSPLLGMKGINPVDLL